MESTANFYDPKDDSLEERINAYKHAFKAWQNIEASLRFHDEQAWTDRLGSKDDLRIALEITESSLSKAVSGLSSLEIQLSVDKNLVSNQESKYLLSQQAGPNHSVNEKDRIIEERKKEMGDMREQRSHGHSKDDSFEKS